MKKAYTLSELEALLGPVCFETFIRLNDHIMDSYHTVQKWDADGVFYRCGGKSLCAVYFREESLRVMVTLGKAEQKAFAQNECLFSDALRCKYAETPALHDGKWIALDMTDETELADFRQLLAIKKKPNLHLSRCGYCCQACKANVKNIRKKDERAQLAAFWKTYYGIEMPVEAMVCDGCLSKAKDARRIDTGCPVRGCVLEKGLNDCSECNVYPCENFLCREGLPQKETDRIQPATMADFAEYLSPYDNKSRLDRKHRSRR